MNPYSALPKSCFWRTGVTEVVPHEFPNFWTPKYDIGINDGILTAGSCFAQHLGWALKAAGFNWQIAEETPLWLNEKEAADFHYGYFSFRTGNIYTTAVCESWLKWAIDPASQDREVWQEGEAFFDPLRPQIEPGGFDSEDDLFSARNMTLSRMVDGIKSASVFVFTLGLTESWRNKETKFTYASCPGTIGGSFDADKHEFHNMKYPEILEQLGRIRDLLKTLNPDIRMLLTVSPVPLTASAVSDKHVLSSSTYSKSVLRAVAGDFADEFQDVDYFPSYEIISSAVSDGKWFEPNRRSVRKQGVQFVMRHFFAGVGHVSSAVPHMKPEPTPPTKQEFDPTNPEDQKLVAKCEDEILDDFNE